MRILQGFRIDNFSTFAYFGYQQIRIPHKISSPLLMKKLEALQCDSHGRTGLAGGKFSEFADEKLLGFQKFLGFINEIVSGLFESLL